MSGVTHGSGRLILYNSGQPLVLYTSDRFDIDMRVRYEWNGQRFRNPYVQLNIQNLFNDQKEYGLIYATPLTVKLSYGVRF